VVFFCQAEDGIRDPLVTGVQTCALPIWPCECLSPKLCIVGAPEGHHPNPRRQPWVSVIQEPSPGRGERIPMGDKLFRLVCRPSRSEERRVGKEWRCSTVRLDAGREGRST